MTRRTPLDPDLYAMTTLAGVPVSLNGVVMAQSHALGAVFPYFAPRTDPGASSGA